MGGGGNPDGDRDYGKKLNSAYSAQKTVLLRTNSGCLLKKSFQVLCRLKHY